MLTYIFQNNNQPLYIQLYNFLKDDIIAGKLKANQKLPAKRQLANHLSISVITIENAYAQLIAEGYIYSIAKKGYYVKNGLIHQKPIILKKESNQTKAHKLYDYDLSSNKIDQKLFPFSVWCKLHRQVISDYQDMLICKGDHQGEIVLRKEIVKHLANYRGIQVDSSQIIIGAGTEYLYNFIAQLLPDLKNIALEEPGFYKIKKIYECNNLNTILIPLDESGFQVDCLKDYACDLIHISPAHQFPTGITMPIDRRINLINWANKSANRYIIEDDYDSEFRLIGKPIPTMQSINPNKVIYLNTFTKSISPAFRIAYLVLPPQLLKVYQKKLAFYSCPVSIIDQLTLAKFMQDNYFERHLSRLKNSSRKKRELFLDLIKQNNLTKKISVQQIYSGANLIWQFNTSLTDYEVVNLFKKDKINIIPLSSFYRIEHNNDHRFLINYAHLSIEDIIEIINRLKQFINVL